MYGLDLFSGIGGITLALQDWVKPVAYCEADRYAQSVLLSRIGEGKLPNAPIWDDVQTLKGKMLPQIDIIYGGFPCQDISIAGLGKGLEGKRSGLFFEIIRLTKETKPSFIFLENVPAIRTRGLNEVVSAFTEVGYDCRWTCVSAASVGANHKRERWFLLANSNGTRCKRKNVPQANGRLDKAKFVGASDVSNAYSKGPQRQWERPQRAEKKFDYACNNGWWAFEPDVGRVVNGLQHRSHRIKALGNAVVPLQVKEAFNKLLNLNN